MIITCRSCCPSCGLHFAGDRAFDLHLGGPKTDWEHRDPREVTTKEGHPRLIVKTREGECRMIPGAVKRPVVIWQDAAGAARAVELAQRREALAQKGTGR